MDSLTGFHKNKKCFVTVLFVKACLKNKMLFFNGVKIRMLSSLAHFVEVPAELIQKS
jgi:hypothetical protein